MTRPRSSYFICCMQRSGSWLLADALKATGRAGQPEEYYWDVFRESYLHRWGRPRIDSFADFLELSFRDGTSANGVFGAKLHWEELEQLCAALAGLDESPPGASAIELLSRSFPTPSFIYLRRADTVRQAISWWRALSTAGWYHVDGEAPPASPSDPPDWRRLRGLEQHLIDGDRRWRAFFRAAGITPLELEYEDLAADYESVVATAFAFLGLAGEPVPAPRLKRQRDERTESWARDYVQARRALWPPADERYGAALANAWR